MCDWYCRCKVKQYIFRYFTTSVMLLHSRLFNGPPAESFVILLLRIMHALLIFDCCLLTSSDIFVILSSHLRWVQISLRMQAFIHLHMLGWMCSLFSVDLVRLMCLCKWKWTSVCGKIHFRGSYPCGKMNTAGSWLRQWDYQQWKHLVVRNGL